MERALKVGLLLFIETPLNQKMVYSFTTVPPSIKKGSSYVMRGILCVTLDGQMVVMGFILDVTIVEVLGYRAWTTLLGERGRGRPSSVT